MKSQTVGLPADSRWVGLQQEAAQKLDESFLVCKLVELADQSHTQLILLAADSITCCQSGHVTRSSVTLQEIVHLYLLLIVLRFYFVQLSNKYKLKKKQKNNDLLTIFVFFFVLFLALLAGWLALRGLWCSSLSRTAGASTGEGRWGGAGHHFTATKGAGEQLQKDWWDTLVHQEANLEQEIQDSWAEKRRKKTRSGSAKMTEGMIFWQSLNLSCKTYNHPSCRTSASWLSSVLQSQHKPSDAPSATNKAKLS